MWWVIREDGKTALETEYRDVAEMTAASLPGQYMIAFVGNRYSRDSEKRLYTDKAATESALQAHDNQA